MNDLKRRDILKMGAGLSFIPLLPIPLLSITAHADTDRMQAAIIDLFGRLPEPSNLMTLKIPALSENGYSVPIDIEVDSPMTESNHVKRIALFSSRNPVARLAVYNLTEHSGRARVTTRVRLGGTQTVHGVAELSDGRLVSTSRETVVTLAACVIL